MKTKCANSKGAESKKPTEFISGKGAEWSLSLFGIAPGEMFPEALVGPGGHSTADR